MEKVFESERLILRPPVPEDAEDFFEWTGDETVNRFMPYPLYTNAEDVRKWILSIRPEQNEFAFVLKSTGRVIGSGSVPYNRELKAYALGYNLNSRYWGMGYATEAAKAMISWARRELNAGDFAAVYADENTASGNVLRKCGLVFSNHTTYSRIDGSATFRASCMRAHFDNDPADEDILQRASALYGFDASQARKLPAHEGGRNTVFAVGNDRILRVSGLTDRTMEDYLAETEYVHYLAENGAGVADVLPSADGRDVAVIGGETWKRAVSMFERAKGDQLAEHGYRYMDDRPIDELWYNTGKTLGRIHALSKKYVPVHRRFDFFDKYNEEYFDTLLPDGLVCAFLGDEPVGRRVKQKLHELLDRLRALPADGSNYGMIHFDYSDGNYNIDYRDGTITVFDFDNCRYGRYLFDLANLWAHGVGWIAWNADRATREKFMKRYFDAVCEGYRSETPLTDEELARLPLLVDAVRLENIIDEFEVELAENGAIACDGEQAWRLKGLLEDAPFMGFFSEDYDPESPFDLDTEE